jgi:hypothetical protein
MDRQPKRVRGHCRVSLKTAAPTISRPAAPAGCHEGKVERVVPLDDNLDRQSVVVRPIDPDEAHGYLAAQVIQMFIGDILSPSVQALQCSVTTRETGYRTRAEPALNVAVIEAKVYKRQHQRARARL